MDGIHDLGGMQGFGPVPVGDDEGGFHARWQGRVHGINSMLIARGLYNVDAFRHGIETMLPLHYLRASYYERWRTSLESLLDRLGLVKLDEIAARVEQLRGGAPDTKREVEVPAARLPAGYLRDRQRAPRFAEGDRVRVRSGRPSGHTRSPGYVRGVAGRVLRIHAGAFVFPDSHAHGRGEDPQVLYGVGFDGRDLWGEGAEPGTAVRVDLFEPYLEAIVEDQ